MRVTERRLQVVLKEIERIGHQLAMAYAAPSCYWVEKDEELRNSSIDLERVAGVLRKMLSRM